MNKHIAILFLILSVSLTAMAQDVPSEVPKELPKKISPKNVKALKGAVDKAQTDVVDKIKKAHSQGASNMLQQNFNEFEVPEIDPVLEDRYISQ